MSLDLLWQRVVIMASYDSLLMVLFKGFLCQMYLEIGYLC